MNIRAKTKAIADLVRPELPLAGGIGVITGQIIALETFPTVFLGLMGFLTAVFIASAAMVSNDYFDLEVDRINRPQSPLPSGRISLRELTILVCLFSVAGFITSALLGSLAFTFAVVIWIVAISYNWRYKETGLLGNMMVGFCVASFFIFGGVTVGGLTNGVVWTFGVLAFIFDLGEEIASDAMDMEGDEKRSARTIARVHGKRHAVRVSSFLFALFVVVSFIPFVMGWLGRIYLAVFVPMDLVLLYLTIKLLKSHTVQEGRVGIRRLYLLLTFFVVVFVVIRIL